MSWKKHFSPVNAKNNVDGVNSPFSNASSGRAGPASANYSSFLPDVYAGAPNRIDRYGQYNVMDQDSEVNAALDILAEFCTQKNHTNGSPFSVEYRKASTNAEVNIIKQYLQQWSKLQKFETRMFRIMRNIFKYGDQFFIRDPETYKWLHVDPANVTSVIVNESEGKIPVQYKIQNINFNFVHGIATTPHETSNTRGPVGIQYTPPGGSATTSGQPVNSSFTASRFSNGQDEYVIDAEHVIHLSLSEGLDNNFPFGSSLLETIYKVYKQKELLEDAIIIYRVQRAPERRVFYVDVGNMPPHLAMSFVERVKTEIHQRRIPSSTGGGQNLIDSSYNPLGITEDYFFPASAEGRGSKVETLPGGCFAMDTNVSLLDGRELSIREIEEEMNDGKTLWTYSCEPKTGKVVPGLISWAGVTQESAQVMKLTLDNGEEIICTPDHKFPQYGEDFKEARDFEVGDSLIESETSTYTFEYDEEKDEWTSDGIENEGDVKISDIEYLDDPIQVGTLTIDQDEVYHDYHTFALAVGVFTKNSQIGEIDDLQYFTNKLVRGLRIPSSYLPTGADDSSSQFNDGRVGTAYIQELRFNTYCERLQSLVTEEFDQEFKRFLLGKGVNIDTSMFELKFHPPQNFAAYRQSEVDNARVGTYSQMQAIPFISNRFALKRFLGLTEEEIAENERLWLEENEDDVNVGNDPSAEMRDAGVSAAGIESDLGNLEDEMDMGEEPMDGGNLDDIETTTDQTVGPSGSGQGQ